MGQAYGFFEIPSVTAAIDAVDIMCKTADKILALKSSEEHTSELQ